VCAYRKNLEDSVPIFEHSPGFQNVSLSSVSRLLKEEEDMWVLAFFNSEAILKADTECHQTVREFADLSKDIGDMIKVGLVMVSPANLTEQQEAFNVAHLKASKWVSSKPST
jgi:hypothetical protein